MEIRTMDEFRLIDLIKEDCVYDKRGVVAGIGDDAAVVCIPEEQHQLISTDMLVEKVHFDLSYMSAFQLGQKAMAVNLSDIAAMGGVPKYVVVSLALPKTVKLDFVLQLYEGMKTVCREFKVSIVGGDTVSIDGPIVVNIAVTGEVDPLKVQRRSGAQAGDLVAVTGTLGDSAAGLELLQAGLSAAVSFALPLVTKHLTPQPQVAAAQRLNAYASSMNDVSDGLSSEAGEIAIASQKRLLLFENCIPISKETKQTAQLFEKPALEYALHGGEDYQLLFTIAQQKYERILQDKHLPRLTVIGRVEDGEAGVYLQTADGLLEELKPRGYNHFK